MRKIAQIFLILFLFSSCYKNIDNTTEEIIIRPPSVILHAELIGRYSVDGGTEKSELGMKINGELYSGLNGMIPKIELVDAVKKGQFVELFSDSRRVGAAQIPLVENETNYTNLHTVAPFQNKELSGNFSLAIGSSSEIAFKGVSYRTALNDPYSGAINMNYSESNDVQYNQQLSTFSFDELGSTIVIQPELSFFFQPLSNDNEPLDIVDGSIELQLRGIEDSNLYHFNEDNHSWEWISKIVDGELSQEIKVTGWFLVGVGVPSVLIEGNMLKEEFPISFMQLDFASDGISASTYTTAGGKFISFSPRNSELTIDAKNNCGSIIFSERETIPNVDEFALEYSLTEKDGDFLKNDFLIVNCTQQEMAQSNFLLTYSGGDSEIVSKVQDSESWIPVCDEDFKIAGYNADSNESGPILDWNIQNSSMRVLSNCASHEDGFSWIKIRKDIKIFNAFDAQLEADKLTLEAEDQVFRLIIEADSKGTFLEDKINIRIDDSDFGTNGYFVSCEKAEAGCGIQELNITHFIPEGDQWNRLYFSGQIWMQTKSPPQSGNFKIEGYILSKK